ncbi:MAG: transketolase-like TK C-terminal-containing protein, partial [Paracoccaceae bacterium]
MAMASEATPTLLVLSRQNLPLVRTDASENLTAKGAYLLRDVADRHLTLIATGSEIEIALAAADTLAAQGVKVAVVSAPCFEAFAGQSDAYRNAVLGTAPRIGVEAAIRQGWDLLLRDTDGFVGMTGFGASAPAPALYKHFNITAEAICELARNLTK